MTLKNVIDGVDEIQPNPYSNARKTAWLNELAAQIQTEVWLINGYEAMQYEYERDKNTELLPVPAAYSSMWSSWLASKIHLANAENDLYANEAEIFNSTYGAFVRFFARTYEPSDPARVRLLRCRIEANNGDEAAFVLPPKALAVNVQLTVTEGSTDSVMEVWAGASKTPIGPPADVSVPGNHRLGAIFTGDLSGGQETLIGVTTYDTSSKAILSMHVFVPADQFRGGIAADMSGWSTAAALLELGETENTAYRGDRGKAAYDHSLILSGNPHGVTAAELGLGNVDNTSDAEKKTAMSGSIAADNTGFVTGGSVYTALYARSTYQQTLTDGTVYFDKIGKICQVTYAVTVPALRTYDEFVLPQPLHPAREVMAMGWTGAPGQIFFNFAGAMHIAQAGASGAGQVTISYDEQAAGLPAIFQFTYITA